MESLLLHLLVACENMYSSLLEVEILRGGELGIQLITYNTLQGGPSGQGQMTLKQEILLKQ